MIGSRRKKKIVENKAIKMRVEKYRHERRRHRGTG